MSVKRKPIYKCIFKWFKCPVQSAKQVNDSQESRLVVCAVGGVKGKQSRWYVTIDGVTVSQTSKKSLVGFFDGDGVLNTISIGVKQLLERNTL